VDNLDIPVELFLGFNALSVGLGIFGFIRQPQVPAMIVFGGLFLFVLAIMTDNVIMGKIPTDSTASGATTTYTFEDNTFQFTELPKILYALVGVVMMLTGAIMVSKT
jgi:hypothetical protein